jgi:hypothetical protein
MRKCLWLAGLALALVVPSAHAQNRRGGPLFFGGVDPTALVNQPIDGRRPDNPIAQPVRRRSSFRLLDFLPKLTFPGNKPVIGQSVFPKESQLPGDGYLRAFGYRAARPVKP